MLSTLPNLKNLLGIALSNTSKDGILNMVLAASDAAVKSYCKHDFASPPQQDLEFYNGTGTQFLVLRQRPVYAPMFTGTMVQGSAVVSALAPAQGQAYDTSILAVGMPATQVASMLPDNTTVLTVDSPNQVTLTANAKKSGTAVPVVFGMACWMDAGGFFGDGTTPYPLQMVLGRDFLLRRDQRDGSSKSGLLYRLGGGLVGAQLDWPWEWRKGTLTVRLPPSWPAGLGNIRLTYYAGFLTVPADLIYAVTELASWMYRYGKYGGRTLQNESLGAYSYGLAQQMLQGAPEIGSVRQILSRWREVSL